jgi:hypothetical protein
VKLPFSTVFKVYDIELLYRFIMSDIMQFFGHKKESTFMKYVQVQRPIDTSKIIDIFGGNLKKVS